MSINNESTEISTPIWWKNFPVTEQTTFSFKRLSSHVYRFSVKYAALSRCCTAKGNRNRYQTRFTCYRFSGCYWRVYFKYFNRGQGCCLDKTVCFPPSFTYCAWTDLITTCFSPTILCHQKPYSCESLQPISAIYSDNRTGFSWSGGLPYYFFRQLLFFI